MAIVKGSREATADYRAQKKKKKEDEAKRPAVQRPVPIYDPENRAVAVARAYYKKTGRIPSADKLYTFVDKTKGPAFQSQEDFDNLFPDWVKEIGPDEDDTHPVALLTDPAQDAFRDMQNKGRILSPQERRKLEQVKEGPEIPGPEDLPPGVEPTQTTVQKKEAAFRLTKGAGTDFFYSDLTDRELAERFSATWAKRKILDPADALMDPGAITAARKLYGGKQRDELSMDERLRLDEFAQKLAFIYGQPFSDHFAGDTKNVVWDDHFDRYVTSYIVEANLPYALLKTPGDPSGEMHKIAMRNIHVATNGAIKEDTPVYELLKMLGSKGDPNDPRSVSDEYAEMLFAGYYNGRRENWTEREAAIAYVADFGEDMLPRSMKPVYQQYVQNFDPQLARVQMEYTQAGLAAEVAAQHPEWAGIVPETLEVDPEADVQLVKEAVLSTVLSLLDTARGRELEEVPAPVETERQMAGTRWSGPRLIEEEPITAGRGGELQGRFPSEIRADYIHSKFLREIVLPMAEVEDPGDAGDPFLTITRGVDRVMTAVSLLASLGTQDLAQEMGLADKIPSWDVLNREEEKLMKQYGIEPDYSLKTVWELSGALTHKYKAQWGPKAFQHRMWQSIDETYGTHYTEDKTLQFVSELVMGLAVDILGDKGIRTIVKAVKTGGISAVRAAKAAEGYKVVKGTEGLAQRETWRLIHDPTKPSIKLLRQMGFKDAADVTVDSVKAWIGRKLLSDDWAHRVKLMEDEVRDARARLAKGGLSKKEAARIADEIAERENTIDSILKRPLWYDSVSTALARDTQNVPFLRRFFDITDEGLGWKGTTTGGKAEVDDVLKAQQSLAVDGYLRQIGKSRNPDEIFGLLNDLRRKYGIELDPGADMLGKVHYYEMLASSRDSIPALSLTMAAGRRIEDGVDDIYTQITDVASATNMGLAKSDKAVAAKQISQLLDEVAAIRGGAYAEIAQGRQMVWNKMWDMIEDNLRARPVSNSERRAIKHLGKVAGVDVNAAKIANRFDLYKAVQQIKRGGKGMRGKFVDFDAKMYFPKEVYDEATGMVKVVEGSKVTRKPAEIAFAEARHREAKSAFERATKAFEEGRGSGMELEAAQKAFEQARAHLNFVQQTRGVIEKVQPFLEGQLAKDLITRHNPHELAVFNSSMMKPEVLLHLGVFYGAGPSIHGASVAFRTFVLGTFGFGIKMAMSDEFWRLIPEGVYKTLIGKNGEFRATLKTLKERKALSRAVANNLTDIMRSSDAWRGVTPDDPDYALWLNAYIDFLRDNERSVDMLLRFPRKAGMADDEYRTFLIDKINDVVLGESREGYILREHLRQMERLPRRGYRTPRGLKADKAAWEREAKKVEADYSRIVRDIDDNRARQERLAKEVGKLGKPTKKYEAEWLRRKYTKTLREKVEVPTEPKPGPRGGKLRSRGVGPRRVTVEREWTDDEVRTILGDRLKDKNVKKALKADYHRDLARKRGKLREYNELLALKKEKKALSNQHRGMKKRLDYYRTHDIPGLKGYADDSDYQRWVEDTVDNLLTYEGDEALREALFTGRKLSKDEVAEAVARMRERGKLPPTVIGVQNIPRFGEGYIPLFSEFAEKIPFQIVDKISNMLRTATFTHYQMKYYDEFIKAGVSADVAFGRASHYALRMTNRVQYTHNMTVLEYLTKDIVLFQPAYRQFIKYWGKLWMQNPLLMSGIRNDIAKDFPAVRIPGTDFETMLPMPFWAQGDFVDSSLPGVGPMVTLPLRVANYNTGWTWDEEKQKYVYTGATELEWVSKIPPLSFMSKNASMVSWLDDILYGVAPSLMTPDMQDNWLGKFMASAGMSLFKDPVKRQQVAMNIMNAQIAAGIKPDFTKAIDEMRKKPGWWKFLEPFAANPDAIIAGLSRVFNPLTGRIWYEPGDVNTKLGDAPFWERWSGTTPRTMADAQWEFMNAYGDERKMREVLEKFPKFAEVQRFWDMTVEERSEYLASHPDIIPYITGKYYYEDGLPLVGGEFWVRMKENGIYRRSLDGYIENMQQLFIDVGFSDVVRKAKKDFQEGQKEADKFAKEAIQYYAKGNKLLAENLRNSYEAYKKQWQDPEPGTKTTSMQRTPPQFLVNYARIKGIEDDIFKWDIGAMQKRLDDTYELVKDGGKRFEVMGLTAGEVEERWINRGIYARGDKYDRKLGALRKLAGTLEQYVSPHHRSLVSLDGSAYWPDISKQLKAHDDYNWYLTKKLIEGSYYEIPNTNALAAIGIPMRNRKALDEGLVELNNVYWDYRAKTEGLNTWDDAYKKARAEYLDKRNKILSAPGLESLAGGPAARAFYTLGNGGKGVSKNFLNHVLKEMQKENPNYEAILQFWEDRATPGEAYNVRRERAAWASLSRVAMEYRDTMKKTWNESMKSYGMSPDSTLGKSYLQRLENYAILWGNMVPDFRKKYRELGGKDLLHSMLDPYS